LMLLRYAYALVNLRPRLPPEWGSPPDFRQDLPQLIANPSLPITCRLP